jgi:hypothetical protein
VICGTLNRIAKVPGWRPPRGALRLFRSMLHLIGGRTCIRGVWEPA